MYPAEFLSDPPSTGSAPWKLAFRSSRAFVISVVAIAVFTVIDPGGNTTDIRADVVTENRTSSYMEW